MAIVAKNKGGSNIKPIEPGMHVARCVAMYHVGTVEEEYQGDIKHQNKVLLTWELPNNKHVFDEAKGEEPRVISKEFTLSMNPKANLRKTLESWRGQPFTEAEAKELDITVLIGIPCMLNISNKESKKGNTYADIMSVNPMVQGTTAPDQIIESLEFNYDNISETWEKVPKFVREKIKRSEEFAASKFVPPIEEEDKDAAAPAIAETPETAPEVATPSAEKPPF